MKYMKIVLAGLVAAALLTTSVMAAPATNAVAKAANALGPWTLSLAGSGAVSTDSSDAVIGAQFQLGHDVTVFLPAELGIRQGIAWANTSDNNWLLSTKGYIDWTLIKLGNLQFDAGANVGLVYGSGSPVWTAAPEVVARLYLKEDVDTFIRVEVPFNLNDGKYTQTLPLTLGVRIRF